MARLACEGLYSPKTLACSVCASVIDGRDPKAAYVEVRNADAPFQLIGRACSVECGRILEVRADELLSLPGAKTYPFGGLNGLASL